MSPLTKLRRRAPAGLGKLRQYAKGLAEPHRRGGEAVFRTFSLLLALDLHAPADIARRIAPHQQLIAVKLPRRRAQAMTKPLGPAAEGRIVQNKPAILLHRPQSLAGTVEIGIQDSSHSFFHAPHYNGRDTGV